MWCCTGQALTPRFHVSPSNGDAAEELGLPLSALLTFPAYMTYSLPGRIAPRAAAARALAGRPLSLSQLATGDEAFVRWLHVSPEEYWAWEEGWRASEDAARWAGDEGKEAAAGGDAAAGLDPA